jgi:hypothetical protein
MAVKTMHGKAARNGRTWGRKGRLASGVGRDGWLREDGRVGEGNVGGDGWRIEDDRAHTGVRMAKTNMHVKAARNGGTCGGI